MAAPAWGGPPVVAVFGLDAERSGLAAEDLAQLTDFIGAALTESGRYQVVPSDEVEHQLRRLKRDSYRACYARACQIEIGKELAAEKSLAGSVKRFGDTCIVTLRLYDLARATQELAGTADGACSEAAILGSLKVALGKLTGEASRDRLVPAMSNRPASELPGADYGDVEAEIEAAAAKGARDAADRGTRERAAAKDWRKIRGWVADETLSAERPAAVLERFLAAFDRDNPHAEEAQSILRRLRSTASGVAVPAGTFVMGCDPREYPECEPQERPRRVLSLPAFRIDRTEVTVADYARCVRAQGCSIEDVASRRDSSFCNWGHPDRANHPMNCVSWVGADAYCRWNGQRLPTDEEWEKAARGPDGRKHPWGGGRASCRRAVIDDGRTVATGGEDTDACGRDSTWPVGSKPGGASPYGAQDMVGNVWEWTSGRSCAHLGHRSIRGGGWNSPPSAARATTRGHHDEAVRLSLIGFRCARSD